MISRFARLAVGATLAALDRVPGVWLEVLGREGERLADAEAASPDDGDQCAVTDPGGCSPRALPHEELDLLARQEIGVQRHRVLSTQWASSPRAASVTASFAAGACPLPQCARQRPPPL